MNKQKINSLLFIIFSNFSYFLLPVIVIINLPQYFWWRFAVYNTYGNFLINNNQLLQLKFQSILDMMNLRVGILDSNFFSREDIIHMQDVRNIMAFVFLIVIIAVIFFGINLLTNKLRKDWRQNAKLALIAYIIILLLIGLPFLINFEGSFILFHQILFRNQYWSLDPRTSNLIKFLPQVIFQEILLIIVLSSAGLAVLNYILALLLGKFKLQWFSNGRETK